MTVEIDRVHLPCRRFAMDDAGLQLFYGQTKDSLA
jgi:hypothetical protein